MICIDAALIGPWVCARAGGEWNPGSGTAIGWIKEQQLVAGVLYCDWNGAQVVCHIAGIGNWLKRRFLWAMFDYPFNQLKVKRISAPVADSNHRCKRFLEHLGFEREANLRDAHPDGDLIIYRMTADQCRWI